MIFENRRYFKIQKFELKKSIMKVNLKTLFDRAEYDISYEHIDYKKKIEVIFNHGLFVSSFFAFAIGIIAAFAQNEQAALVFFLIGAVCFTLAFFLKKRVVTINVLDGTKIELYFNSRNKDAVVAFADEIIQSSNKHLLHKYGKVDKALPIDPQINSIQFLRDREIITEEEYESLKDQLLGRTNKANIGFSH
jgi:uncharacterized membrane protein (Fun14 family)